MDWTVRSANWQSRLESSKGLPAVIRYAPCSGGGEAEGGSQLGSLPIREADSSDLDARNRRVRPCG